MGERRAALRVPVHGVAVWYGDSGRTVRGTIENLSSSGALLAFRRDAVPDSLDLELALGAARGRVAGRAVRRDGERVAIEFHDLEPALRSAIDEVVAAGARRPVLVLDDDQVRRRGLLARLTRQGMTPLAPRTPLEAIDVLTNPQLAVSVALLAPSFGHTLEVLHGLVADSFPWVRAAPISDDLEDTVERALRLAPAVA